MSIWRMGMEMGIETGMGKREWERGKRMIQGSKSVSAF